MYFPSGVHSGETYWLLFPLVSWVVSLPSSDMIQRFSPPLRSETKTTRLPSGERRGCASYAIPLVRRVARPPADGEGVQVA